jgi:hypothetical protein
MCKNLMELMRNFEMVPRLKKSIKVTSFCLLLIRIDIC